MKPRRTPAGELLFPVPRRPRVTTCAGCPAEVVWIRTDKGKRMPLHWASRRRVEGSGKLEAEPHWGFCPAAAGPRARWVECQAERCSRRQPRLFCEGHRALVPEAIVEWIERVQSQARENPQAHGPRREYQEALRAAVLAVKRMERA